MFILNRRMARPKSCPFKTATYSEVPPMLFRAACQSARSGQLRSLPGTFEDVKKHGPGELAGVGVLQRWVVAGDGGQTARQRELRAMSDLESRSGPASRQLDGAARGPAVRRRRCGPRHTTTRRPVSRRISSSSQGAQGYCSSGVGLLAGGAQRTTAAIHRSWSVMPSSARPTALGWDAKPASCKTGKRKSPEPSPVNIRPVPLEPCAPGASPDRPRNRRRPKEDAGRPQYSTAE